MPDSPDPQTAISAMLATFKQGVGPDAFDSADPGQTLRQRSTGIVKTAHMPTLLHPAAATMPTLVKAPAIMVNPAEMPTIQSRAAHRSATTMIGSGRESLSRSSEFTIHDLVGKGGMGQIFRAGQNALRREVAIKKIIPEHLTKESAAQMEQAFVSEALITGYLDHPNIVPVYSLGRDDEGKWFFTMKMVRGIEWRHLLHPDRCKNPETRERATARNQDIDDPARRAAHLDENLRTLLVVCNAVAFAHSRKTIHRDLKPENVMVGAFGEVLVMDWGLAVDVSDAPAAAGNPERRVPTRSECGMGGTPSYMAPEQIVTDEKGQYTGENLDCWTDVFLLGAMLHELLTGAPPYEGESIRAVLVKVALCEPPKLPETIAPELAAICRKALAKNPRERYADALEFQQALNDFLKHKESAAIAAKAGREATTPSIPNLARAVVLYDQALELWPQNVAFHDAVHDARKRLAFLELCAQRTRRSLLAAVICIVLGLTIGFFWIRNEQQKLSAAHEKTLLAREDETKAKDKAVESARQASVNLANGIVAQGDSFLIADRFLQAREKYENAWSRLAELHEPTVAPEWGMWAYYQDVDTPLLTLSDSESLDGTGAQVFSPDGKLALISTTDNSIKLWDITFARPILTLIGHTAKVNALAFSPDGKRALSGSADGSVRLWDLDRGTSIRAFDGQTKALRWVAFSADGKNLLAGCSDKMLSWDAENGAALAVLKRDAVILAETFSPKTSRTFAGGTHNTLSQWNTLNGEKIGGFNTNNDASLFVLGTAISPDGTRGLSGGTDKIVRFWDLEKSTMLREFKGHKAAVSSVALSSNGKYALTGSWDLTLKMWDVGTGAQTGEFNGHTYGVTSAALSPDGRNVLSRSLDHTIKLWDTQSRMRVLTYKGHDKGVECIAVSPDGRLLFSAGRDFTFRIWDVDTGRELQHYQGFAKYAEFLPDGKQVVTLSDIQGLAQFWDVQTGEKIREISIPSQCCDISIDAKLVLAGGDTRAAAGTDSDKRMRLVSLADGKVIRDFGVMSGALNCVAFSHDEKLALCGCDDDTLQVFDVASGKKMREFKGRSGVMYRAAFSPNGKQIITGGLQGVLRIWDLEHGSGPIEMRGHAEQVTNVSYSEDGAYILSASKDATLKLWDAETGDEFREFSGHEKTVTDAIFTLDEKRVFSASEDGTIKLWDGSYSSKYRAFSTKLPGAQKKLSENADDSGALEMLGEWYAFRGVCDKAVAVFDRARSHGAEISSFMLGRCYAELGDYKTAIQFYDSKSVALRKESEAKRKGGEPRTCEEVHLALCLSELHARLIESESKAKNLPGYVAAMRAHLAQIERDFPPNGYLANSLNTYAWTLLKLNHESYRDPQAALQMALRSVALTNEKDSRNLDTLAWAYFQTDGKEKAIETQKKAIAALPENAKPARRKLFEEDLKTFEAGEVIETELRARFVNFGVSDRLRLFAIRIAIRSIFDRSQNEICRLRHSPQRDGRVAFLRGRS